MRRRLSFLVCLGFLSILGLTWLAAQSTVWGHADDTEHHASVSQTRALRDLTQLVMVYEVDLNESQIQSVVEDCRLIINRNIRGAWELLQGNHEKYSQVITVAGKSLKFISNNLTQIAQDHSAIDLLLQRLEEIEAGFSLSFTAYDLTLNQLLILGDACQDYPQAFVVGLMELHQRHRVFLDSANELLEFVELDFEKTLSQLMNNIDDFAQGETAQ